VVLVQSHVPYPTAPGEHIEVLSTGFFVDADGRVLTSLLAVTGSASVQVWPTQGEAVEARILAMNQACGLVLLETGLKDTVPLEFREAPARAGQWVLAASASRCPEDGVELSLKAVVLSNCNARLKLCGIRWNSLLQMELPPRRGLASVPLLDSRGALVGVVVGARGRADGGGCCYALPAKALREVVPALLKGNSRRLGWLGVAVARSRDQEGLTVRGVLERSPAFIAGVRPGDVLLEVDGETITEPRIFESKVVATPPGGRLRLRVLRGSELKELSVQVGLRPLLICSMPAAASVPVGPALVPPPRLAGVGSEAQGLERLRWESRRLRERIRELEVRLEQIKSGRDDSSQPPGQAEQ